MQERGGRGGKMLPPPVGAACPFLPLTQLTQASSGFCLPHELSAIMVRRHCLAARLYKRTMVCERGGRETDKTRLPPPHRDAATPAQQAQKRSSTRPASEELPSGPSSPCRCVHALQTHTCMNSSSKCCLRHHEGEGMQCGAPTDRPTARPGEAHAPPQHKVCGPAAARLRARIIHSPVLPRPRPHCCAHCCGR